MKMNYFSGYSSCFTGCLAGLSLLFVHATSAQVDSSRQTEGLRENPPAAFVLQNARIVVAPGNVIENGTLVIRDGRIVSVRGAEDWPADHRLIDLTGKTIYAGLIDGYREETITISETPEHARYWNVNIRPERDVTRLFAWESATVEQLRNNGFAAALVSPGEGIFKGAASLVLATTDGAETSVVSRDVGQSIELTVQRGFGGARVYPSSPMGAIALARQAMNDAAWYRDAWQVARQYADVNRPEFNQSLESLQPVLAGEKPVIARASNELMVLRAHRFAREFGIKLIVIGSGNEYRRLEDIRDTGRPLVIPVNFTAPPDVRTLEESVNVTLEELMHWDLAPENPKRLAEAGVEFAFTSSGLDSADDFLPRVRQAVARGLSPEAALAALTTVPAKMFGAEDQLGTLETGKLANLVVTDGDLFKKETKILETWVAGRRHEIEAGPLRDVAGKWKVVSSANPDAVVELTIRKSGRGLEGTVSTPGIGGSADEEPKSDEPADDTVDESEETDKEGEADESDETEDKEEKEEKEEKDGGDDGPTIDNLELAGTLLTGSYRLPSGKEEQKKDDETESPSREKKPDNSPVTRFSLVIAADSESAVGNLIAADGTVNSVTATRIERAESAEKDESSRDEDNAEDETADEQSGEAERGARRRGPGSGRGGRRGGGDVEYSTEPASYEPVFPLGKYGLTKAPEPRTVLFQNVTVWTCGPSGVIEGAAVLVSAGRIEKIFAPGDELPAIETVVDGTGKHLTPGIIDCHSHMATDSGVNEGSQAITAEVRIGDFIDCDDITIYRQLAGGVTASNILHGSANPIGGQNQVIKLRWGLCDEDMKMTEAPQGIKFALGENVKRSNSPRGRDEGPPRYPTSRMGVEQLIRDEFRAAQDYRVAWRQWRDERKGLPPRRDLELEAIAEILEGQRWIHCHSYRQDEILALIRLLDEFGVTIGTFQHILEGYKVADEMARHGAMASAFSDWWAYKFEVYDAIPYAGALMHDAGVVVSFNSDDGELATHLNQEAAKAVRYGGVSPEEALKFVTLNPAKQLRIDQWTGSIEPGKHADLVLWNGPPLSGYSRVEQTWIDGRLYFGRLGESDNPPDYNQMHAALVQKVLRSGESPRSDDSRGDDPQTLWPRYDENCGSHIGVTRDAIWLDELQRAWEADQGED